MKQWKGGAFLVACFVSAISLLHSQVARKDVAWPVYGGGPGGMRYSTLDQINQHNVQQLRSLRSRPAPGAAGASHARQGTN